MSLHEDFFLVSMLAEFMYSMVMVLGFIMSGSPSTCIGTARVVSIST